MVGLDFICAAAAAAAAVELDSDALEIPVCSSLALNLASGHPRPLGPRPASSVIYSLSISFLFSPNSF